MLNIVCHKSEENCGILVIEKHSHILIIFANLLVFISWLCKYFLHNLIKYCSIFKILDIFQQPTERAVEKCPRWKSLVHYKLRNCKMKSVKSFAGHPVKQGPPGSLDGPNWLIFFFRPVKNGPTRIYSLVWGQSNIRFQRYKRLKTVGHIFWDLPPHTKKNSPCKKGPLTNSVIQLT